MTDHQREIIKSLARSHRYVDKDTTIADALDALLAEPPREPNATALVLREARAWIDYYGHTADTDPLLDKIDALLSAAPPVEPPREPTRRQECCQADYPFHYLDCYLCQPSDYMQQIVRVAAYLYDNRLGWSDGRNPYAPPLFWDALGIALRRPPEGYCDPSRRKLPDFMRDAAPPVGPPREPTEAQPTALDEARAYCAEPEEFAGRVREPTWEEYMGYAPAAPPVEPQPPREPRSLTLTGDQVRKLYEAMGGDYETEVTVQDFDAAADTETGDPMPAGLYLYFTEYPEEGRIHLPEIDTDRPKVEPQPPRPPAWTDGQLAEVTAQRNAAEAALVAAQERIAALEVLQEQTHRDACQFRDDAAALSADALRIDWLQEWRRGDVTIMPPGQHGGAADHWLVSLDAYEGRGIEHCGEWEGESLRAAIDAALSAAPAPPRQE